MKVVKNKFITIVSTIISLFGVAVASVSTYAWFQLNTVSKPITKTTDFDTDSTQLNINAVSGYKYTYDQIADGQTAETGTVTGESAYGNIDEDLVTGIDAPQEGVGFYILGDEDWATAVSGDANDAMTYRSAIKMEEQYNDNFAVIDGLYLTAGQQIAIKQYTYDQVGSEVKPVSYTVDNLSGAGTYNDAPNDPATFLSVDKGVFTVQSGQTGTYKMYINNQRQIYLHPSETERVYPSVASRRVGPKRALEDATPDALQIELNLEGAATGLSLTNVKAHLWNITFADGSGIPDDIAPSALPTISGVTWGGSAGSVTADLVCTAENNNTFHWAKAPWFIYQADCMFFNANNGKYLKSYNNGNASYVDATAGNYSKIYYGWYSNISGDKGAWDEGPQYQGNYSTGVASGCTISTPQYTISYFKNSADGTSLGTENVKKYTYYAAKNSFKSGGGQDSSLWRGWNNEDGTSYSTHFILGDTKIIGRYVRATYFKLYIVKQRYNHGGSTTYDSAVQFGSTYVSDDEPQTQFDPSAQLTDALFAGLPYGNSYTYSASTAEWHIGSKDGDTYDKGEFTSFGYTAETAVSLYVTVVEKTITVKKYWVTLNTDWSTVNTVASSSLDETWGADENNSPAAFTTSNLESKGFTDHAKYEAYDSDWRSGSTVGSGTVSFPRTYGGASETQSIYKLYKPKKTRITYNYEFYYREKTGVTADGIAIYGDWEGYDKLTSLPVDYFDAFATTTFTLAAHQPTHQSYCVSDLEDKAVYRFDWDGKLYNTATGDEFTSGTFTPSSTSAEKTFSVKMYCTYEKIYVANENSYNPDWYGVKNCYLQVRGSKNYGIDIDTEISSNGTQTNASYGSYHFMMSYNETDGVNYFKISDGVSFAIHNGGGGDTADYTTQTLNTSSPDSYGTPRGTYSDTMSITSGADLDESRKWRWSTYYGNDTKSAKLFFEDNDLSKSMHEGDGKFNLFVCDSGYSLEAGEKFAIRLQVNGTYKWFDYDDLDDPSKLLVGEGGELAGLGETNDIAKNKSTTETVDNAILISASATYNIYFTINNKIALAKAPAKGDGYYIMNYDPDGILGNADTNSYYNGVKMRRTGYSYTFNVAYYNCFHVSDSCKKIYLKSYIGGVDNGPFVNLGKTSLARIDGETGIIEFVDGGNYSIFLRLTLENNQDVYTVFITEYPDNFYILNRIPDAAGKENGKTIKDYNTSLVLEVEFTYTADVDNDAMIGIDITRNASGSDAKLSKYLVFNVLCSDEEKGKNSYAEMRGTSIYNAAQRFASNSLKLTIFDEAHPITADTSDEPTPMYLYILVDYYDYSAKDAEIADLANDFTISLRARSL